MTAPLSRMGVGYQLHANENPYPPLPSVLAVVQDAAAALNRYPDIAVTELTHAIARHHGLPAPRLAIGTGSVGVLAQIIRATCAEGDEVVYAWRSFEAYPLLVAAARAVRVEVPITADGRHDLKAMADAVTPRTRLVLVCTPNNPTGTTVHASELSEFLDRMPHHVLVVLDEAYFEFVRDPQAPDALAEHRARPNVCVLRTFSKAYGLAGLRVGYAVAHEHWAEALRRTAVPFGVTRLAERAAVASLAAEDELLSRVAWIVAERDRVSAALRGNGWNLPDTRANFVWLPLGPSSTAFAARCTDLGLSVRLFAGEGVRCTVAETEGNDLLLEACGTAGRWA